MTLGQSKVAGSPDRNEWATPGSLFEPLNEAFDFVCDLAASSENAQCNNYITKEQDALTTEWPTGGWGWCNPPFSMLPEFTSKALSEFMDRGANSVILVPANRCEQEWFHRSEPVMVVMISGRVNYIPPKGIVASSCAFGSMLLVYGDPRKKEDLTLRGIGKVMMPI